MAISVDSARRTAVSRHEARRIALAAQGFSEPRRGADRRALRRVFARVGIVQIDSVNVLVRSHYLPAFSRLGPYDPAVLEREAYGRDRQLFEYWAHEASLVPLALHPLLRWRMQRARDGRGTWGRVARVATEAPQLIERVRADLRARGPSPASAFEGAKGRGSWWGWSEIKIALEYLFWSGEITTLRRERFERVYDFTENVLPAAIMNAATPDEADAQRELVRVAARALGIAAERDLRDYFRLDLADARARVAELVESGELVPVTVEDVRGPMYLASDARIPRRIDAAALLSPFDSLVWERSRNRVLFDFDFRLEIYTPQHKRVHGYYVLPFLLGDRLVARIDLKHDRAASALRVIATHLEPDVDRAAVRAALTGELALLAEWLGAERVVRGRA